MRNVFQRYAPQIALLGASLVVIASFGLARFSYSLLLPFMKTSLGWTSGEAGLLATMNFVGYVCGAVLVGQATARFGPRKTILGALAANGLSLYLTGTARSLLALASMRVISGAASAFGYLPVFQVIASHYPTQRRGAANGIAIGAAGLSIFLMGLLLPAIVGPNTEKWPEGWKILGIAVLVVLLLAYLTVTPRPSGADTGYRSASNSSQSSNLISPADRSLKELAALYFLFGLSYTIYTTFFVDFLVSEAGLPVATAGGIWSLVGLTSIFGAPIFGGISDRFGRANTLMLSLTLQAVAIAVPLWRSEFLLLSAPISTVVYGLTSLATPTIVSALCADLYGKERVSSVLGRLTVVLGVGQILGPLVGGFAHDLAHTYAMSFGISAAIMLGAILATVKISRSLSGSIVGKVLR